MVATRERRKDSFMMRRQMLLSLWLCDDIIQSLVRTSTMVDEPEPGDVKRKMQVEL